MDYCFIGMNKIKTNNGNPMRQAAMVMSLCIYSLAGIGSRLLCKFGERQKFIQMDMWRAKRYRLL